MTFSTMKRVKVESTFNLPSGKLTWQWKSTFSNRKYIFKWWIFHCYVSLLEGIISYETKWCFQIYFFSSLNLEKDDPLTFGHIFVR